jgi:hypothetical protein
MHGAGGKKKGHPQLTANLKHGRYAWKLKRGITQMGVDRLEELARSPEVLNIARTTAASQYLLEEHLVLDPTDGELDAMVRKFYGLERDAEVTEEERNAMRMEHLRNVQKAIETHAAIQERAKRALTQEAMLSILVVPLMSQLAEDFMRVLKRRLSPDVLVLVQSDIAEVRRTLEIKTTTQLEAGR